MTRRLLALAAAVAVAMTACARPADPPRSALPSPTGQAELVLGGQPLSPCRLAAYRGLCGTLRVAEDRSSPGGRQIDLRVVVVPAKGPVVQPDPVVFLTGGPGGAATEDAAWAVNRYASLNATRDFVLVDQRGTGGSNRLVAPPAPDVSDLRPQQATAVIEEWVAEVVADLPGDPRFYSTAVAMDDLDEVRAALGYDRVNLFGWSYGATAAQYYLRQHPQHVRSVVLDGGTLLDVPIFEQVARNSQRALDLLFDRCASDAVCDRAYPQLRSEFRAVLRRLTDDPVTSEVAHPSTGEPIVLDGVTFAVAVHSALLNAQAAAELPRLIHAAFAGDVETVAGALRAAAGPRSGSSDQLVMSAVIRCSEAWARFDPARTAASGRGSYYRDVQVAGARAQAQLCPFVPRGVLPADDAQPVRSDVPALLTVGEADPQDPPGNVADAATDLPNSLTVVVPGQGHTVAGLGCLPDVVTRFIEAGTVDGLDTSCVGATVSPPSFRVEAATS